jgi:DNA polymerase-4
VLARTELAGLPGLGSACRERAAQYGIHTAEQVLSLDRQALRRRFGTVAGERLYGAVRGLEAEGSRGTADIEAETVLREDANDERLLRDAVALTADRACHQLRHRNLTARSLTLRILYSDNRRLQRTARLASTTDDLSTLCAAAQRLFEELHVRRAGVRSIAVAPTRTSPATGQHDLFDDESRRRRDRLGAAITDIRQRMGFGAVVGGGALEITARE